VLAGPVAWATAFGIVYSLTKWSCNHTSIVLQLVIVAALAVTACGAFAAWQTLMLVPAGATDDGGRAVDRTRFMGILGLCLSALFGLLILAQSVPIWTLHGVCW